MVMEEPEKPETKDPFWDKLGEEITNDYKKDLEYLMKNDTIELNGETYKFQWVKSKYITKFKKLDAESFKIVDKDSDEWYNNVKERACMVIQDMTPEKFEEGDYVMLENLTTGWANRAIRGFRRAKQSVPNVL